MKNYGLLGFTVFFQLFYHFLYGVGLVELLGLGVVVVDLHKRSPVVFEGIDCAYNTLAFLSDESAVVTARKRTAGYVVEQGFDFFAKKEMTNREGLGHTHVQPKLDIDSERGVLESAGTGISQIITYG